MLARRLASTFLVLPLALTLASGCATGERAPSHSRLRNTVSILSPRCEGVRSCVLGHVTAAGSAVPIAEAAVFLEREEADDAGPNERAESGGAEHGDEGGPLRILALTDAQGVFEIDNPPPGSYRLAIYKDDSSVEVAGLELGRAGTTVLPVRLVSH
jgi:hypothetical protein